MFRPLRRFMPMPPTRSRKPTRLRMRDAECMRNRKEPASPTRNPVQDRRDGGVVPQNSILSSRVRPMFIFVRFPLPDMMHVPVGSCRRPWQCHAGVIASGMQVKMSPETGRKRGIICAIHVHLRESHLIRDSRHNMKDSPPVTIMATPLSQTGIRIPFRVISHPRHSLIACAIQITAKISAAIVMNGLIERRFSVAAPSP